MRFNVYSIWCAFLCGIILNSNLPLYAAPGDPTTGTSAAGSPAVITVDRSRVRQTFEGLGGDYAKGQWGMSTPNDAVGTYTLEHLNPHHARVAIPLPQWAPEAFPPGQPPNWDTRDTGNVHGVFLLLQQLSQRHIPITLSIWNAPDWMVQNPGSKGQRVIAPTAYPAVVEALTAFLVRARELYGAPVETISFNESDGGYQIKFTPQDYAGFIAAAGRRFHDLHLETKWLAGDTSNTRALVNFTRPILEDPAARPYLGPISFHSWDAYAPDAVFEGVAALGEQYHKPVWCVEVGYNAQLWQQNNPSPWPTWKNALELAKVYYKVIHFARASRADYWEYQADYPLVSEDGKPYPAFYVIQQLNRALPPGSKVVEAAPDNPALLPIAATGPRRYFMLQVINTAADPAAVSLRDLPDSLLKLVRSSSSEAVVPVGEYRPRAGVLSLTLPGESVSTLVVGRG